MVGFIVSMSYLAYKAREAMDKIQEDVDGPAEALLAHEASSVQSQSSDEED